MAASVSQDGRFRAVFLSVIMVLMTQVGYTDNMDFSIGLNQDTESKDTGSSTPALTPSVEGADLMVGDLMDDITFQYNASAASGSGSGSNSGTYNGNGTAWMVNDIRSGIAASSPQQLTVIGNTLYFSAHDGTNGIELWKSDGTSSGTVMVKDIHSGSSDSSPNHLTAVGNTLYFSATDGTNGIELWKSDGTSSGTVMVEDIHSGSSDSSPNHLTAVGNTLYFTANDGTNGIELWKSDGTTTGTVMVKNIQSGGSSSSSSPARLTAVGNTLYFSANDGGSGTELWKSDGTESGTVLVRDISSGTGSSYPGSIGVIGNTLYFRAHDGTNGYELWKSDGTSSGTVMVKDINSGVGSSSPDYPTAVGNTVFFIADDGTNGIELWKSDGTSSGTVMVKDITGSAHASSPNHLTAIGNTLYFSATDGTTNGTELWKSDGTVSGTVMVRDINSGSSSSNPIYFTVVGNTLYFRALDGIHGTELWKSDGTTSGTVLVQDINSGGNAGPRQQVLMGNTLYFQAYQPANGGELWALDPANITGLGSGSSSGSGGGMTNVTGANCTVSPALPTGLSINSSTCTISGIPSVATSNTTYTVTANISGTTYQGTVWLATMTFGTIISPVMGAELDLGEAMAPITLNYTSQAGDATVYNGNGTAWMVKDIFAGQAAYSQGSNPQYLTAVGDTLFFNAKGGYPHGYELWKSDGTEAGTVMVKEIEPGNNMYNGGARYLTAAGDTLYFTADDGIHGLELWKSDGTEAGTVMVKDLWPGNDSSGSPNDGFKERMTAISDIVYFAGNDGVNGYGLYKSDGTANGTEFISSPFTTHPSPSMYDLVAAGDTLYFHATSTGQNADMALYKSDGTANGTVMLKNIACGGWTCRLTPVGDKLFFSNDDGVHGQELWISDGTVNGTVMVKDIAPIGGSNPFHTGTSVTPDPAVIGNTVFFMAYESNINGYELWKSDGTEAGTVQVSNMCCSGGSAPNVYGDSIFFPSDAAGGGIWRSDGTSSGTVLETNSVTTANEITGMGNTLYFSYANPDPELWAYNPTNLTLNTPPPVSWETYPALPAGMSISNGVISGTPTVYAVNQTYTVYANQSGETTTFDMYFSVDTNNPHTVVENQPIDAIGFQGPFQNGTTTWTVSPALPADLVMDPNTGEITGSVNGVLANTTYTVNATHSDGATETFTFSLQSLADFDGDGLPNDLPSDYDAAQGPTPGLVADTDDDADGLEDVVETGTSIYVDSNNTGSNPLDPDTDDDGICDGPNAVPPICIAGPDSIPNGDSGPPIWIGLFNKEGTVLGPYKSLPGGTYEIMPDLPQSLTMDPNTGVISGTPTQTLENTTFTVWVNRSDGASLSWNFSIEILADSDGDGFPDELPDDYNSSNPTAPGLVEDLDDDNDGIPDLEEDGGLDTTNPDTDGDGICDGVISVDPICVAGPDAFPLDPSADTDTDGDGKPDTITGNSTSVPPLEEDMDDDGDGADDINETNAGTDPLNPDTDGDGVCDGPNSVWPICINGPDSDPLGANDGGNIVLVENIAIETPIPPPNQVPGAVWEISPALPAGLNMNLSSGIITGTATEVSDNTTYTLWANVSDFGRNDSVALSVMATFGLTVLEDSDGDGMPDELPDDYDTSTGALVEDLDDDNDGLLDTEEEGLGTDPNNPDSDGDGFCDGPTDVYADDGTLLCRGPDPEPLDSALPVDTDGDMFPDEDPDGPGGLEADTDDDGDGFSDELENNCGSDSLDANDAPVDLDGDTICDMLDADIDGDGLNNTVETNTGIYISSEDSGSDPLNPDTDGDGYCDGPVSPNYSDCIAGPDAFPTDASAHLDTDGDGDPDTITGYSTTGLVEDLDDDNDGASDLAEADCGTDPLDASETPETDSDGNCVQQEASAESLLDWNWGWCFCLILLLLLLLLIPIVMQRDRILVMMGTGPEPENTTSEPEFVSGAGTLEDPFILAPAEGVKAGKSVNSTEVITIDKMTVSNVDMVDFYDENNGNKFSMFETGFDEIGVRIISVGEDGGITINMHFDDAVDGATYAGGKFTGLLKLGSASVYLSWTVTVEPDKKKLKEIEKAEKEAKKAEKEAKKAEEAAAKKQAKEEAATKKKAEEEAAAALLIAEEEEEAAAALLVKEEEAAKKKAKEEADAAANAKPATKEAKKKEELKRVKANASKIDFKVLGTAKASEKDDLQVIKGIGPFIEEKLNALGIYTYRQISKMNSKLEDSVNLAIEFFPGRVKRDQWVAQAKILLGEDVKIDEKALKKAEELERVAKKAEKIDFGTIGVASASDKDNLQELKGIGPFIEEKLNALGIYKFEQIAKMTSKIEDEVNIAIEFFSGRVKRDEWVKQAKERTK